MITKSFTIYCCIKEFKRSCIPLEFLKRSYPCGGYIHTKAFIILLAAVMSFLMVILFEKYLPVVVQILEGLYLFSLSLIKIGIYYLMKLFDFPFALPTSYRRR